MNNQVYEFLANNNNDPYVAWNEYIKHHLLTGKKLPNDIKGIRDFIKASKPNIKSKYIKVVKQKPKINTENLDITAGITQLKSWVNMINSEIECNRLINNNMSYCCNEIVKHFNSMYNILEIIGILPYSNSYNLTCIQYTKSRINIINNL